MIFIERINYGNDSMVSGAYVQGTETGQENIKFVDFVTILVDARLPLSVKIYAD